MSNGYDDRHWHLDKRVPIALIITILMQTVGIVWWAASLSERVTALENRFQDLRTHQGRIVRLEEKQTAVHQRLDRIETIQRRIENKIDRLLLKQYERKGK
jgi:Tfp pilus assembly protein PilN